MLSETSRRTRRGLVENHPVPERPDTKPRALQSEASMIDGMFFL